MRKATAKPPHTPQKKVGKCCGGGGIVKGQAIRREIGARFNQNSIQYFIYLKLNPFVNGRYTLIAVHSVELPSRTCQLSQKLAGMWQWQLLEDRVVT